MSFINVNLQFSRFLSTVHPKASTMSPHHFLKGLLTGQHRDDSLDEVDDERDEGYYSYIRVTPLQSSSSSPETDGSAAGAPLGLGLLIAMVSVAIAIVIIALLISKMRRRQSADSTDIELEVPTDPYLQAIMFPSEPRPEWHRHLRQVLHKAGQKIFKKPEHHDTHIPEDLRYQLKQIYVY